MTTTPTAPRVCGAPATENAYFTTSGWGVVLPVRIIRREPDGLVTVALADGGVWSIPEHALHATEAEAQRAAAAAADRHVRQIIDATNRRLDAERARWVADGCPSECVRPAGEAFSWRLGAGPCDCPPCMHRHAAAHTPATDAGPTV